MKLNVNVLFIYKIEKNNNLGLTGSFNEQKHP